MSIDMTLSLGDVLTASAIFGGGLVAWGALRGTVLGLGKNFAEFTEHTEAQFADVKAELRKLGDVMVMLAESKGRMDRMDDRAIMQGGRIDENAKQLNSIRDDFSKILVQLAELRRSNGVP